MSKNSLWLMEQKFLAPNFVQGKGWKCAIRYDGSIRCECNEVKDGKHYFETILHISKRGNLTFIKAKDGVRNKYFGYKIKNWPVDGQFVLGDGVVEDRKAFFLDMQKISREWQRKHGVSEVKIEDPNGIRFLEFYYFEEDDQFSIEHIETDGKVEFIAEDFGVTLDLQVMYPGSSSFEHYVKLRVTNATWTIITKISTKESSRILYTQKDVMLLRNLPEGPKNISEEEN